MIDLERTSQHLERFKRRIFIIVYIIAIVTLLPSFSIRDSSITSGIDALTTPIVLGIQVFLLILLIVSKRGLSLAGHMLFLIPAVFLMLKLFLTLAQYDGHKDISATLFLIIPWALFTYLYSYLVYGSRRGLFMSSLFYLLLIVITLYTNSLSMVTTSFSDNEVTALLSLHLTGLMAILLFYLYTKMLERHTEAFYSAKAVARLASLDTLTQLPNRKAFLDDLGSNIAMGRDKLAVLFIDLDRFKAVNDTKGHAVGDELLKEIARRLKSSVRSGDLVARLSGDEFTVVLYDCDDIQKAEAVARKILEALTEIFSIEEHNLHISASIGISLAPQHGLDVSELLTKADSAMYRAKRNGKNRLAVYTEDIARQTLWHSELEQRLYRALKNEDFKLHYQPIIDMASQQIAGFEALLRWNTEDGRTVAPQEFIPIIEGNGMIVPIGEWIANEACRQIKEWHEAGFSPLSIAINVSAIQILQPDFADMIKKTLKKHQLSPRFLELEVTESGVVHPGAIEQLSFLRSLGMTVAVDDFGTGYSSLAYLQKLPIDVIKIDKRFVDELLEKSSGATLTKIIVSLAQALSKDTIAEGVESKEQLRQLEALGCNKAQGYLFSKPLQPDDAKRLLEQQFQVSQQRLQASPRLQLQGG